MLSRFFRDLFNFARHTITQIVVWAAFARSTVSGFATTAHRLFMILAITAIAALGLMFVNPDMTDHLKALSPFSAPSVVTSAPSTNQFGNTQDLSATQSFPSHPSEAIVPVSLNQEGSKGSEYSRQQEWVTNWLSKRYRVAADATNMLVSATYLTAKEIKLDPLLILSVMAIESGFNPFAESPVGAQGLMQVMSKIHRDKFEELGGIKAALNPIANIKVGALILKDYVNRAGSVEAGLKLYVGAGALETDSGYGAKVLAEYKRLKEVAVGKHVPIFTAPPSAPTLQKPLLQEPKQQIPAPNETSAPSTLADQQDGSIKNDNIPVL